MFSRTAPSLLDFVRWTSVVFVGLLIFPSLITGPYWKNCEHCGHGMKRVDQFIPRCTGINLDGIPCQNLNGEVNLSCTQCEQPRKYVRYCNIHGEVDQGQEAGLLEGSSRLGDSFPMQGGSGSPGNSRQGGSGPDNWRQRGPGPNIWRQRGPGTDIWRQRGPGTDIWRQRGPGPDNLGQHVSRPTEFYDYLQSNFGHDHLWNGDLESVGLQGAPGPDTTLRLNLEPGNVHDSEPEVDLTLKL